MNNSGSDTIHITIKNIRLKFSKVEIRDTLLSIIALSTAFSIIHSVNPFIMEYSDTISKNMFYRYFILFMFSFALVIMSFLTHELGHKIIAQAYGF